MTNPQRHGRALHLATVAALALALGLVALAQSARARVPVASPAQATPAETTAPTEALPTPIPPPGTAEPTTGCLPGVAGPRFQWTLYIAPHLADAGTGMWVPFGEHGGPYLKAYVKALYGDVWYGGLLDGTDGSITPDPVPAWPRPDIVRLATSGVQTTRVGSPMCGRSADATLPPCYAELVVPLVFLDRLAPDGPYLRHAYFWAPSNQVVDEDGTPSRMTALAYDSTRCDIGRAGARLPSARPVYAQFSGCSSASRRIDTCYLVGCGDQWLDCR